MHTGLPPSIGDYEPLELLAEGGMARVVVARRLTDDRPAALKLILPELAEDAEYTTMFLDEARINARVDHPNVVQVYEAGRDRDTQIVYLALELVLGATLSQVLRAHRDGLDWRVAASALAQAAEGLAAAHAAKNEDGTPLEIVHRDVSPQNLLIDFGGRVRVSDFGVARAARRATRTKTGQFKGKLSYCAPEHALGHGVDARADVFSLGTVAFETLANIRLFARSSPFETLAAIAQDPIPSLAEVPLDLPSELTALVDAMLAREPDERVSSCNEVAIRLRAMLDEPDDQTPLAQAVAHAATPQALRLAGRRAIPTDSGTHLTTEAVTRVEGSLDDLTVVDEREPPPR